MNIKQLQYFVTIVENGILITALPKSWGFPSIPLSAANETVRGGAGLLR